MSCWNDAMPSYSTLKNLICYIRRHSQFERVISEFTINFHRFLELLDESEYIADEIKLQFYRRIISDIPKKPKWMYLMANYMGCDGNGELLLAFPDFLFKGLLYGTPIKGEQR